VSNRSSHCKGKVIVFGIAFWYPLAGVTYQFLHYLLGLRRLGYDVYYVEDTTHGLYDPASDASVADPSANLRQIVPVLEAYGFADRWALRCCYPGGGCFGMSEQRILGLYREADAYLNVTGSLEVRDEHLACRRRIYVESDPCAAQILVAKGNRWTIDQLAAHDVHFSFGENLGAPDCLVPIERFTWLPTRQPVALDLWQRKEDSAGDTYTTITTWRNKGKEVSLNGEVYQWTKHLEFLKIIELPQRCRARFALGLNVRGRLVGQDDLKRLADYGWGVVNGSRISARLESYRSFIQDSRCEFTVARDQYVRPRTGWFSDRSACYLAAGRPVITQDTGFGKHLPTGHGLFAFTTLEDVVRAVEVIESDYGAACRAAYEIAAECFAAERVLGSLMARAGL
jgi:hypothetical protein